MSNEQILYARQPIVDRNQEIYGYELLFRSETPGAFDGNLATSQVLLNAFTEGDIEAFMEGGRAFVNFTKDLLTQPPPFDKKHLIIEILENIELDADIQKAITELSRRGFSLALDDYVPGTVFDALLPSVSFVKLEYPAIEKEQLPVLIENLKEHDVTILAEKIETHEDFKHCMELGCDLFQGYFYSKPQIVTGRRMPQNKMAIMELIAKVQNPVLAVDQIIHTISRDPYLSIKLLQLINSAAFRRPRKIESIHMAVMLLGISRIKAWSTLLALSNIDDKPNSLVTVALIRAHMCELIADVVEPKAKDTYFTIGLFSCLEAFFDTPLADILRTLPLDDRIKDALLKMKGKPGLALNTVLHYERTNFDSIHWRLLEKQGVTGKMLSNFYKQSIHFAYEYNNVK